MVALTLHHKIVLVQYSVVQYRTVQYSTVPGRVNSTLQYTPVKSKVSRWERRVAGRRKEEKRKTRGEVEASVMGNKDI